MTKARINSFRGVMKLREATMLPEGYAQEARNVWLEHGDLRPLETVRVVQSLGRAGVRTIYRFGQATRSETDYWFSWTTDVDVVKVPVAGDVTERTVWTGDGVPRFTTAALGTSGFPLPSNSRPLALPPPAAAPTAAVVPGTGLTTTIQRDYVLCMVNEQGDISAPSPICTIQCLQDQHVVLSNLATTALNGVPIASRLLFRSESGAFLLVAELNAAATTFTDNVPTDELGAEIASTEWDPPPDGLFGLTALPNGLMAGFQGRDMYFCEPYRPYAWPEKYRLAFQFPVVGAAVIDSATVVVTTGTPYIVTGVDPSAMDQRPASASLPPGVSKRSIVSSGSDAYYASDSGICRVGAGVARVDTAGLFSPAQWRARYNPPSIVAVWHDGAYIASYLDGTTRRSFVFWPESGAFVDVPDMGATAFYRDTVSGNLFVAVGDQVAVWRGGSAVYASEYVSPKLENVSLRFTWVAVRASSYPVVVQVWADGVLRDTVTLPSPYPQRIGDPTRQGSAAQWWVRLQSAPPVQVITLATNPVEAADG